MRLSSAWGGWSPSIPHRPPNLTVVLPSLLFMTLLWLRPRNFQFTHCHKSPTLTSGSWVVYVTSRFDGVSQANRLEVEDAQRYVCMIHSTEEVVFKGWLMIQKTKARLVAAHRCDEDFDPPDRFQYRCRDSLSFRATVSLYLVHLQWKTKPDHIDEFRAILPLEGKIKSEKITAFWLTQNVSLAIWIAPAK